MITRLDERALDVSASSASCVFCPHMGMLQFESELTLLLVVLKLIQSHEGCRKVGGTGVWVGPPMLAFDHVANLRG